MNFLQQIMNRGQPVTLQTGPAQGGPQPVPLLDPITGINSGYTNQSPGVVPGASWEQALVQASTHPGGGMLSFARDPQWAAGLDVFLGRAGAGEGLQRAEQITSQRLQNNRYVRMTPLDLQRQMEANELMRRQQELISQQAALTGQNAQAQGYENVGTFGHAQSLNLPGFTAPSPVSGSAASPMPTGGPAAGVGTATFGPTDEQGRYSSTARLEGRQDKTLQGMQPGPNPTKFMRMTGPGGQQPQANVVYGQPFNPLGKYNAQGGLQTGFGAQSTVARTPEDWAAIHGDPASTFGTAPGAPIQPAPPPTMPGVAAPPPARPPQVVAMGTQQLPMQPAPIAAAPPAQMQPGPEAWERFRNPGAYAAARARQTYPEASNLEVLADERDAIAAAGGNTSLHDAAIRKATQTTPVKQWQPKVVGNSLVLVNPYTGETKQAVGRLGQPTSKEVADMRKVARTEYATEADGMKSVNQALSVLEQKNPMGDIGAIFTVMKSLDPTSVVRESEQRMVAASQGSLEQFEGWIQKQTGGGPLTPQIRNDMRNLVIRMAENYEANAAQKNQYWGRVLSTYGGIPPEDVIGGIMPPLRDPRVGEPTAMPSAPAGAASFLPPLVPD